MQREHWSHTLVTPWSGIQVNFDVARDWKPAQAAMIGTQVLFYLAVGVAGTIAAAFLLRPSYAVWMALNWLQFASQSWDISAPRYTLTDVPAVYFDRDTGSQASLEHGDYRMVAAVAGAVHERVRPRPLGVLIEPCGRVKWRGVAPARRPGYF